MEKKVAMIIQSQTDRLNDVREFIGQAARDFGFDEEAVDKIALAVDEACTNVIKHSYRYASDKNIEIMVTTRNSTFEVIIYDEGVSFDPVAIQQPDMKEYLRQYKKGGLGMHLMRSLMDKVEYRSMANKKNETKLIKYLPSHNKKQDVRS